MEARSVGPRARVELDPLRSGGAVRALERRGPAYGHARRDAVGESLRGRRRTAFRQSADRALLAVQLAAAASRNARLGLRWIAQALLRRPRRVLAGARA